MGKGAGKGPPTMVPPLNQAGGFGAQAMPGMMPGMPGMMPGMPGQMGGGNAAQILQQIQSVTRPGSPMLPAQQQAQLLLQAAKAIQQGTQGVPNFGKGGPPGKIMVPGVQRTIGK